jgi:hypothetical protein
MGEVVDLEIYRKRSKRGAARGQGPGNRRSPDQGPQCAKPPGKKTGPQKPRSSKSDRLEPSGKAKIESNDSKSD